jgi:hypothetical protein
MDSPITKPYGHPELCSKKVSALWICTDYRGLNAIMIKNHYHRPLINETLDWLSDEKISTQLNLRNAYHGSRREMKIKRPSERDMAFSSIK